MTSAAPQQIDKTRRTDGPSQEERIRMVFRREHKLLCALFPSDGETMVARACAAAVAASKEVDKKSGKLKLGAASPEAIAEKVIAAHHLGVEIGDQAYLVPFGSDVQLIVGPKGLTALAYKSGFVKSLVAETVFEADADPNRGGVWDYDLGDSPFIRFRKAPMGRRDGCIIAAFCVIETTTQGKIRHVITGDDIEYYRGFSKATGGPWETAYDGMCRKTVIKRTLDFVPHSPMLAAALRETPTGAYEMPAEMWADVQALLRRNSPEAQEVLEEQIGAEGQREMGVD